MILSEKGVEIVRQTTTDTAKQLSTILYRYIIHTHIHLHTYMYVYIYQWTER